MPSWIYVLILCVLLLDHEGLGSRRVRPGRGRGRSRNSNRNSRRRLDTQVVKPGIKARITQHGFDFAADLAIDVLLLQMGHLRMPDITETVGMAEATVSNIQIANFPKPDSHLESMPGFGVRWRGTNMHPYITADYSALFDFGFYSSEKTGRMGAQGRNMDFTVDFFIGRHSRTGRPVAEVHRCRCTGSLDLDFVGQWSDMLNLGSEVFKGQIEDIIHTQICNNVKSEINTKLNAELSKMPVSAPIDNNYLVDYHLVRYPEFFSGAMEAYSKGVVYSKNSRNKPPFQPTDIPLMPNHTERMMYVYITDYTLNSGLYAAFLNGHLRHNINVNLLPPSAKVYLNTTCPRAQCLGTVFPKLGRMHPNSIVNMEVKATRAPKVFIRDSVFNVSNWAKVDLYVNGVRLPVLTLDLVMNFTVDVYIDELTVRFNVTDVNSRTSIRRSRIGPISSSAPFEYFLLGAMQQHFFPVLQAKAREGVRFPVIPDVALMNLEIVPSDVENIFIVGGDVAFNLTLPSFA